MHSKFNRMRMLQIEWVMHASCIGTTTVDCEEEVT